MEKLLQFLQLALAAMIRWWNSPERSDLLLCS